MGINKSEKAMQAIFKTSERIDNICTEIYKSIESTKMDVVKEFSPFIRPKKNLEQILEFYNKFIEAHEAIINTRKQVIDALGDTLEVNNLSIIFENNLLKVLERINIQEDKLNLYKEVNIANDLSEQAKTLRETVVESIMPVYFQNLYNKEVREEEMQSLSCFLIKCSNKKTFLSRYSNAMLEKTTYDDIKLDRERLLERTVDINEHFNSVNKYNIKILGYAEAQSINSGLNKLLLISLKRVIADILIVVEKEESLSSVPFCLKLNSHLRQGDEAEIKEVEELYVYKNEINKIICNIFLAFIDKIKTLETPNKFCDVETLVLHLKRACDAFKENKNVGVIFIKNFGPFFKVNSVDDFCNRMTIRTLERILALSEQLEGIRKSIYLINNFFTLQNFAEEVDNINVKELIDENTASIVNIWKEELESREGKRFTTFIDNNCMSSKSYYLPETIRNRIVPKIKSIIWENIVSKGYQGDENSLNDNINDVFTGK